MNSITAEQAEANKLMARLVAENKLESEEDAKVRRKEICETCDYWSEYGMCDYILREGHIRPCVGRECVEKGFFKPAEKKKKRENAWVK